MAWGMDVIGPIEPSASNGYRFILVAINYFTKWVEATSHKLVTKKVVADFVKNNLICRFGIPESIITDNRANLNSHLMKDICEQFKITHRNSAAYRPQMNGAVEAANKNLKRILRKMIDNYKNWHKQLSYDLSGYRTTTRTSTGQLRISLSTATEAVILAEVEIPSLRIIQEAELNDTKWVRNRYEQLAMIDEKRMVASCSYVHTIDNENVPSFQQTCQSPTFPNWANLTQASLPSPRRIQRKICAELARTIHGQESTLGRSHVPS
ncbi:uncharacterized protein LOC132038572 [Lycium ferocissimum]|uniref:uncharacterized protein LOC132038572 n=1 Tax=Lycium ferocissimum TaxID=112874 RepID=UPI002815FAFC|nr:uncharacterized protein LOC132038572 [Lycium ferocissimum]